MAIKGSKTPGKIAYFFGDHKAWMLKEHQHISPDLMFAFERANKGSILYCVRMWPRKRGGPKMNLLWCLDFDKAAGDFMRKFPEISLGRSVFYFNRDLTWAKRREEGRKLLQKLVDVARMESNA